MDGCNCDWDSDTERGYFRCYTDPRCKALNESGGELNNHGPMFQEAMNSHVSAPFRGVLNAWARGQR